MLLIYSMKMNMYDGKESTKNNRNKIFSKKNRITLT